MKYLHLLFLLFILASIAYLLKDTKTQEGFLNNIFSKKEDDKKQNSVPLTQEQKDDNASMNSFLKNQNSKVDTNLELNTSQMPLSKLTPQQLEEREKIIQDIKTKINQKEENPIKVELPKGVETPKSVEQPVGLETPKGVETPKVVETPKGVEPKVLEQPKLKADKCRFLSSQMCNTDYPVFMGASLNGGNGLTCNDEKEIVKPEAMAQIENGEVKSVVLIKGGKGFDSAPKVTIKGDRYTMMAKAIATVNKDGEVDSISVVSGGSGYVNTPKVEFEYDENNKGCFLCCRLDLFN